jgi:hypothetical protein
MMWLLYPVDAGLLVTSGLIHLHLWDIAYRNVGTLDVLFLVQTALCLLAALALLITRHLLVVLGAAALIVEGAGAVMLLLTAALLWGAGKRAAPDAPDAPDAPENRSSCPQEDNPCRGRGTA